MRRGPVIVIVGTTVLATAGVVAAAILFLEPSDVSAPMAGDTATGPAPRTDGPGHVLDLYEYEMLEIPRGDFVMGSPEHEPDRYGDETLHEQSVDQDFLLGEREVDQAFWAGITGDNPQESKVYGYENRPCGDWGVGDALPVACVTFDEVITFLNVLSRLEGYETAYRRDGDSWIWDPTASGYRLPTEAEWEYAARAGSRDAFAGTDDPEEVCEVGNVATRATKDRFYAWLRARVFECTDENLALARVGSYTPNPWGLHDMTGNVREWVWDLYAPYPEDPLAEPPAPERPLRRITRGGGWTDGRRACRIAARTPFDPDERQPVIGLRLARNAD